MLSASSVALRFITVRVIKQIPNTTPLARVNIKHVLEYVGEVFAHVFGVGYVGFFDEIEEVCWGLGVEGELAGYEDVEADTGGPDVGGVA